jgi:hypothetical protein
MTMTNMERLKDYFSHFDGTCHDFENDVRPKLENLYHPDMRLYTDKGETKTRDDMIDMVRRFNNAGGKAEMTIFEETPDGDVLYAGRLSTPCGLDVNIHSLGTFQDGKLVLIQPTDPEVYMAMMHHDYKMVVDKVPEGGYPGLA